MWFTTHINLWVWLLLTSWCTAKLPSPIPILQSKPCTRFAIDFVNKFIIHKRTDYDTNCDFLQEKGVLLTRNITWVLFTCTSYDCVWRNSGGDDKIVLCQLMMHSVQKLYYTICFSPEAIQVRVKQHIAKHKGRKSGKLHVFLLYIIEYLSTSSESNALLPIGAAKFQCLNSPPKSFIICQVHEINVAIADNY